MGFEVMRLYGAIQKVEPQDDGTVRVHGIAASEAVDDQGEIVRAEAMRGAVPDYMRFPALREMHQLSAAGTTLEAEVCEDGTTRIVAHVVDPIAVAKVKSGVYRGFSIGGRVTQREPGNPKAITGLVLNEISLVDRPANPEAVFDCWKASSASNGPRNRAEASAPTRASHEVFNAPIQVWACGVPDHRHLAKSDALKCLGKRSAGPTAVKTAIVSTIPPMAKDEGIKPDQPAGDVQYADPGYQPAGKKRYPIKEGPPFAGNAEKTSRGALTKALGEVGHIARVIIDLDQLTNILHTAAMESGVSQDPGRVESLITELCGLLNVLLAEEVDEILGGAEIEGSPPGPEMMGILAAAAGGAGVALIAALLGKNKSRMRERTADLLAQARRSQADQALLEMAYRACNNCVMVGGLSAGETEHIRKARDHLLQAGAVPAENPVFDSTADEDFEPQALAATIQMMEIAHQCLSGLSDGTLCGETPKLEMQHSAEVMEHLDEAHRHLIAAGATCEAAGASGSDMPAEEGQPGGVRPTNFAKALAEARTGDAGLADMLAELVPTLERLTKRVDDIERAPLPPQMIAKGTVAISKEQDRGSIGGGGAELSPEAVASALAKMSKEEQTMMLIKASYANPIRVPGSAARER